MSLQKLFAIVFQTKFILISAGLNKNTIYVKYAFYPFNLFPGKYKSCFKLKLGQYIV